MIAYIRGRYDEAMHLAKQWALQNNRSIVAIDKKKWHKEHDFENDICYVISGKSDLPDCDECIIFAYGHRPPRGIQYIKVERQHQPLSFQDFLTNYREMGDMRRDPEFAVMMKRYLPKEIVASWLYVNYEERRQKYEVKIR